MGTYKLYNAMNKYGKENFYVETIESGIPIDKLDKKEIQYIEEYDSYKNGYNSTKGGDGRIFNSIEDENELLELAKKGKSGNELSKIYNVNKATIFRTLHRIGFYYNYFSDEYMLELYKNGKEIKEIAKIMNRDVRTISRHLKKYEINKNRKSVIKRKDFKVNELFDDYF